MYLTVTILSIFSMSLCYSQMVYYDIYRNGSQLQLDELCPDVPTHMYLHGFLGNTRTGDIYCNIVSRMRDINCISVDWMDYTNHLNYFNVKSKYNFYDVSQ